MASKYGVAFTKSKALHALLYIASVHDLFWNHVQNYFSGNKRGNAYTRKK